MLIQSASCHLWCMLHSQCLQASALLAPAPPSGQSVWQHGGVWLCHSAWNLVGQLHAVHFTCEIVKVMDHCLSALILAEIWLTLTRRCDVGPSRVGKHFSIPDYSNPDLIGTAFKPNYYSHGSWTASFKKGESNMQWRWIHSVFVATISILKGIYPFITSHLLETHSYQEGKVDWEIAWYAKL